MQPPDLKRWGARFEDEIPQGLAVTGTGGEGAADCEGLAAPKIAIGTRVECFFKNSEKDSNGEWYAGKVTSQIKNGSWRIKFDDGEEHNFEGDDPDLRLETSGPWATWLDAYLPDLLLSAYRAARRTPTQLEMRFFNMLQNPEQFGDSAEFQPRNFCDVVSLCDVVNLCNEDDAVSIAETPAKNLELKKR